MASTCPRARSPPLGPTRRHAPWLALGPSGGGSAPGSWWWHAPWVALGPSARAPQPSPTRRHSDRAGGAWCPWDEPAHRHPLRAPAPGSRAHAVFGIVRTAHPGTSTPRDHPAPGTPAPTRTHQPAQAGPLRAPPVLTNNKYRSHDEQVPFSRAISTVLAEEGVGRRSGRMTPDTPRRYRA